MNNVQSPNRLPTARILRTWWPLAGSWLLMTTELPLISAVIARLVEPEINLAAWGIIFAVSTIVQSPSTMLLAASTALSTDWESYRRLRRYMLITVTILTGLHILIAFSPLYFVVMERVLGVPPEIVTPARLGLMIMTPWTAGTAFRRFQQGVLIRFDHSRTVIWGSLIRVAADGALLLLGYLWGGLSGVVVGAAAIITGVISEAVYAGWRVRPVLRDQLKPAVPTGSILTFGAFLNFYLPLAVMVLLLMAVQPMVSAGLSRMPRPLDSLAVWPVVFGLLLMWQSAGISYNEAVIALLDQPHAVPGLRRFTTLLVIITTALLLVMTITPLAALWFKYVAGLSPALVELAQKALWLGLLLPGLRVLQSWYQGAITYSRHTRGITEAVVIFLLISSAVLWGGVWWGQMAGLYVGLIALTAGLVAQALWLAYRARPVLQAVLSPR